MKKLLATFAVGLCAAVGTSQSASADQEPYIGQVMTTAGGFCPRGWAQMEGQLLSVADYPALFGLLGAAYGGDGRTTFALPDAAGRVILTEGQGPGLAPAPRAQKGATGAAGTGGTPTLALHQCIAVTGEFPVP